MIKTLMPWALALAGLLIAALVAIFMRARRNEHLRFQKKLDPRTKGVKR